jgi:ABC-type molybdate transport system ATPase subunit
VVLYTDRKTKKINGALLYNVHGFGEEMARRLMNDMQPVKEGQVKEYGKLFEFWEALEASPGSKDKEIEEVLTESEVEAYQMRED